MRKISLIIFLFSALLFFSCIQSEHENNIVEKIFSEAQMPDTVVNILLNKIKLKPLKGQDVELEIRRWGPFFNDSFPIFMERLYVEKNHLKAEIYFFSTKSDSLISSFDKMTLLKYEKRQINDFPKQYMDSLLQSYNLFKIKKFDTTAVQQLISNGYLIGDMPMVLNEQSRKKTFISIYSRYPRSFKHLNDEYKYLDNFQSFTDSLILEPAEIKNWYNKKLMSTF